jgi:bifunctional DNA-binding transcriptional regulator/antitoxin component of YhaV-PrlF toxin-antitoxin module
MVSQDILDKLETTVRQFLDEGRMFTGYDVTIETRQREKLNMRHQDVREGVHELDVLKDAIDYGWDTKNGTVKWTKTQQNMPGGGWAWIFHPTNLDPRGYQPRQQGQTATTTAPTTRTTPSLTSTKDVTNDSGGEQDDGTFATDYRNRLMIPTKFLKEAGLKAGDTVFVAADNQTNCIVIAKDNDAVQGAGLKITTQLVERNGDLRLSSKTLKSADLQDSKFTIETADKSFSGGTAKVVQVTKNQVAANGST